MNIIDPHVAGMRLLVSRIALRYSSTANAPRRSESFAPLPRAAILLVNKLKGEQCIEIGKKVATISIPPTRRAAASVGQAPLRVGPPSSPPGKSNGEASPISTPSASTARRAHADPGTGLLLLPRLASMGVLSSVEDEMRAAGSPAAFWVERRQAQAAHVKSGAGGRAAISPDKGTSAEKDPRAVKWTVAASLDAASEGLVVVASHGWLAEFVRRQPDDVTGLMEAASAGREKRKASRAAKGQTMAATQESVQAPEGAAGGAEANSSSRALIPTTFAYRMRVRGRLRRHALIALARGARVEGVVYPSLRLAGPALEDREPSAAEKARGERQEGQEGKQGRSGGGADRHNTWYDARTNVASTRALRDLLRSYGCPPSRMLRTRFGPFELGTIPSGAALHVPVPMALVREAWEWSHSQGKEGGKEKAV